ncbi:MAG: ABC transporter ATP-binding protein [Firmicutes bacterium]|nr:ABC transporter ATP-binding protein [Bacillota bacterium]
MFKKLFPSIKGYGVPSIFASLAVIVETVFEVLLPFLMMKIVDVGIANADLSYVIKVGLLMVVTSLASLFFGIMGARLAAVASTGFAKNVRGRLFHAIQDFSFANIDRFSTASLITRLTIDVTNTQMAYMITIRMLVRAPVMMIAATIMAIRINASLAMIFVVAVPVLAVVIFVLLKVAYPRFGKMLEKYDAMNGQVQEKLTAIRVIKAFVREDYECHNFEEAASTLRRFQLRAEKMVILAMPVMMTAMYSCIIAVLWFGGLQIIGGTMEAGALFSFIGYVAQILMSLMMISVAFMTLVVSRASIRRIVEIIDEQPDIADNSDENAPAMVDGSISFSQVDFSYNKDAANLNLQDINLEIKSGQTIGIIGGTGSAKTTLVQLIPRLYDVLAGSVQVGGHDVREYKLDELRENVAMVLQNNLLFSGTIAENLRWGKEDATDEELIAAAKVAQADEFISAMPEGYQTMLGQAGVNLSGGQKQRLCIARALLKHPKIIILDDSTSAVDTATDARIRDGFKKELAGTTTIIIAQRISSVMDADQIVVMEEGKISAIGTHQELLASNKIYDEVFNSQQKGVA